MLEKREGDWRILHRIVAADLDRGFDTIGMPALFERFWPRTIRRGDARGKRDLSSLRFEQPDHQPERTAIEDLWGPFSALRSAA